MACTSPISIGQYHSLPCGQCMACRLHRTQEWALRMVHEASYWDASIFITLTYRDEELPDGESLKKRDCQLWLKRLRKDLEPRKIKYFISGEYGDLKGRPHYHGIIFGMGRKEKDLIDETWGKGRVDVETFCVERAAYVSGYIQKKLTGKLGKEVYGDLEAPFALQSQGLGLRWLQDNESYVLKDLVITNKGVKHSVPRYYMKKLGDKVSTDRLDQRVMDRAIERSIWLADRQLSELEGTGIERERRAAAKAKLEARMAMKKPRK